MDHEARDRLLPTIRTEKRLLGIISLHKSKGETVVGYFIRGELPTFGSKRFVSSNSYEKHGRMIHMGISFLNISLARIFCTLAGAAPMYVMGKLESN